jgi:DNA-binding transcriptional MerR regulator
MTDGSRSERSGSDLVARDRAASDAAGSITIGDLAREFRISLRALRFYQAKGLLTPARNGPARLYSGQDRERLTLILQGKRLGFTLAEIRQMIAARVRGPVENLPMSRKKCVEQINLLESQRIDIDRALVELRCIYTALFTAVPKPLAPTRGGGASAATAMSRS